MESVLKWIARTERTDAGQKEKNQELMEELWEVKRLIACNDRWFEMECQEDLIEACIYQREELQARYRHLIQAARRQGITVDPFQTSLRKG